MATWAIGDVQGCLDSLEALLRAIDFKPGPDTLWFTGDLVNRGPKSADVLRLVRGLHPYAISVIGNHDLNLLAIGAGLREPRARDTVGDVLSAPDRAFLFEWIRHMPVMHVERGFVLVHAGLMPGWSIEQATRYARAAEAELQSHDWKAFMARVYPGGRPAPAPEDEVASALAQMTYVRCVDGDGRMVPYSGPPSQAPPGAIPWYERWSGCQTVVFGHWAAAGFARGERWAALDSGCVWGDRLTAMRLEDGAVVQVEAVERVSA